jgi:signal transduction histidine kinase
VIPFADVLGILALAGSAALVVALVGAGALSLVRRRPLAAGLAVLVLTIVGAGAAATTVVGLAMFLSAHDLRVLLVVVVVAAAAGTATAVLLTRRLVAAVRDVAGVARALADEEAVLPPDRPLPAEFAALVDDLVATADRLQTAHRRERALEASRRELVGWVSHDLRTPLAGLRAMVEALEDGVVQDDAEVGDYHRRMRGEIERLSAMVDDLFELSRLHAGTLRLPVDPTVVADLVSDAVAAARPVARARGVGLEGRVDGDALLLLPSAPLERVLANLVSNAVRHTPRGGTVVVEGAVEDGRLRVAVQDGCGGIPEEDLPRVFDVGFRGSPSRTPGEGAGGGLGLSIARGLAEAAGGTVEVANSDAGCRFTLRLVATGADTAPAPTRDGLLSARG